VPKFTQYRKRSGEMIGHLECAIDQLAHHTSDEIGVIEGHHDMHSTQVDLDSIAPIAKPAHAIDAGLRRAAAMHARGGIAEHESRSHRALRELVLQIAAKLEIKGEAVDALRHSDNEIGILRRQLSAD
jgi:hypothetical protein